jgi:hypothetical protein
MTLEEAKAIKPTPEDLARLERLRNIRDEDIDYSDIPEFTDEELAQFRRVDPNSRYGITHPDRLRRAALFPCLKNDSSLIDAR